MCLTTRVVHLELIGNLSTDNFIIGIKRLILRRGYPVEVFSEMEQTLLAGKESYARQFRS